MSPKYCNLFNIKKKTKYIIFKKKKLKNFQNIFQFIL